jgi:hypothetical protein
MKTHSISNAIEEYITALDRKYDHAIAIFGGALFVYNDIESLVRTLPTVIKSAKFFGWHENSADTCRTFCHCAFVDPALIETYIGMKFEKLVKEIAV